MDRRRFLFTGIAATSALFVPRSLFSATERSIGADIPWITYPAADMKHTGTLFGPKYGPFLVEMESTRNRCVKLSAADQYIEFTATAPSNTIVIRYSIPDSPDGKGLDSSLNIYRNGKLLRTAPITSRYSWMYGDYPFKTDPRFGSPRNFYDDVRLKDLTIEKGDVIRIQKAADQVPYCIIDLVDLEMIAAPAQRPADSLSVMDFGAKGDGKTDDTDAFKKCIAAAAAEHKTVWIPASDFKITSDLKVPTGVSLRGAGMWHTTFVGDEKLYQSPDRRVRIILTGDDIHLADFAIIGRLKYRDDAQINDGVFGSHATNCSVSRLWIEHTKSSMWFNVCNHVTVDGCRLRNTLADGVNLCVDTRNSVIQNCTARNTGDDCFAVWPATFEKVPPQESTPPGNNVIRRCTGELPFLANGGAIYGGANNRIEDCLFRDIQAGCGVLISSTFPTADPDRGIDNNFSGTTVVQNCKLERCGGFDHDWAWRGAIQVCVDLRNISGIRIADVSITDSLSDAINVIGPGSKHGHGTISDAHLENVTINTYGTALPSRNAIWISPQAEGSLTITDSHIGQIKNDSRKFKIVDR